MNATPKYVVSKSLTEPLPWGPATLIHDDVPGAIRGLRAGDGGDILVIGSSELVQTLMHEHLVDEYRLMIHPIVLGTGTRLFRDDGELSRFTLVESTPTSKGRPTPPLRAGEADLTKIRQCFGG
jgi:dihydrofolate reductase